MSHTPTETIICPNCGSVAEKNYCSECGQETHLHNETFWGLVAHFVGHYFHYDSKFWKTLKALWFSPGKLTTAYWNKQRMRYIPPVSLYIFISAVFFILMALNGTTDISEQQLHRTQQEIVKDSLNLQRHDSAVRALARSLPIPRMRSNKTLKLKVHKAAEKFNAIGSDEKATEEFGKGFVHNFPKVFFFLIPFMAALLKLFFIRRKQLFFVHHAIFSLHVHSFSFSILLFTFLPIDSGWVTSAAFLGIYVYLTMALKSVYNIGWFKSILYSSIVSLVYSLFALIAILIAIFSLALS